MNDLHALLYALASQQLYSAHADWPIDLTRQRADQIAGDLAVDVLTGLRLRCAAAPLLEPYADREFNGANQA